MQQLGMHTSSLDSGVFGGGISDKFQSADATETVGTVVRGGIGHHRRVIHIKPGGATTLSMSLQSGVG